MNRVGYSFQRIPSSIILRREESSIRIGKIYIIDGGILLHRYDVMLHFISFHVSIMYDCI